MDSSDGHSIMTGFEEVVIKAPPVDAKGRSKLNAVKLSIRITAELQIERKRKEVNG